MPDETITAAKFAGFPVVAGVYGAQLLATMFTIAWVLYACKAMWPKLGQILSSSANFKGFTGSTVLLATSFLLIMATVSPDWFFTNGAVMVLLGAIILDLAAWHPYVVARLDARPTY